MIDRLALKRKLNYILLSLGSLPTYLPTVTRNFTVSQNQQQDFNLFLNETESRGQIEKSWTRICLSYELCKEL